jgi:hypothetical protein
MTIVAIWYEPADKALWSVSDTRISAPGKDGGTIVRTDSGAKLLALPVVCRKISSDPNYIQSIPHYSTALGFAFSGDLLPATLTYATASTLLQNLMTLDSKNPPHLNAVAQLVRGLCERFTNDSLSTSNGAYGRFTSAVFGWCPHEQQFQIFLLEPAPCGSLISITVTKRCPINETEIVAFGSGMASFTEEVSRLRERIDSRGYSVRIPKLAIEAMISTGTQSDIGGSISIGIASKFRFEPFSRVHTKEPGNRRATISFNGIDLRPESIHVDQYIVGMMGMV